MTSYNSYGIHQIFIDGEPIVGLANNDIFSVNFPNNTVETEVHKDGTVKVPNATGLKVEITLKAIAASDLDQDLSARHKLNARKVLINEPQVAFELVAIRNSLQEGGVSVRENLVYKHCTVNKFVSRRSSGSGDTESAIVEYTIDGVFSDESIRAQ